MRTIRAAALLYVAAAPVGAVWAQAPEVVIHSVTDISHEFTFYFDGRFASNYIAPDGDDARNWATLYRCDLSNVNLLILPCGPTPCPYLPQDITAVRAFLSEGGGVVVLGDYALFRDEREYHANELAAAFGTRFVATAAAEPLRTAAELEVDELKTYGGGTIEITEPDAWHVLVKDAEGRIAMARREVGKGTLVICSRALSGRQPDAKDPINEAMWRPLLKRLADGKAIDPSRPLQGVMPEIETERSGMRIRHSEYLQDCADTIFGVFSKVRPEMEKLLGVPPHEGMLTSLILLPTGGGGFSDGTNIGLGVWWGGFPDELYGMVELIGHESMHSWVLPFAEPMWNEGIATYVGILMGRALGLEKEAQASLDSGIAAARKHDPDMTKYDLARGTDVPHAVAMGKPMWILEQLRTERPDILSRYFRLKRELCTREKRETYAADDCVAVLSLVAERDLFEWFRSLGIDVSRDRTDIAAP